MKIRSIKIDRRFIPEWNENKSLPASEQVVIYFSRIPGTSEKGNYKSFKFSTSGSIELSYNDNMMVASFVSKIENLEMENGEKIKNGQALAGVNCPGLSDLFTEIRDYLFPDGEDMDTGESKA